MNKRGDIASIIYIVLFIFTIGVIVFYVSHLNSEIFTELSRVINETGKNTSYIGEVISKTIETNNSVWDYAFLGVFLGSLLAVGLSAYAIRISPVFYWIYGILALVVLALGTILSTIWQGLVSDPVFTTTLTRFPITNSILGTYYPMVVTAMVVFAMVIIFGKPPGREEAHY